MAARSDRKLRWWLLAAVVGVLAAGLVVWLATANGAPDGGQTGTAILRAPAAAKLKRSLIDPPLAPSVGAGARRRLFRAADNAARELAGADTISNVSFDAITGLWDRTSLPEDAPPSFKLPTWWQSALAMRALVRYLIATDDRAPAYQRLISDVYELNLSKPGTPEPANFENNYMDDTGWWGLAWVQAARYERNVAHDLPLAARYLALASRDASYIDTGHQPCHSPGIAFKIGLAPNTLTNAEFVALAAELAQMRSAPGPLHRTGAAALWLSRAKSVVGWLQSDRLIDVSSGVSATYDGPGCKASGPEIPYVAAQTADALTELGIAAHNTGYETQAARFLRAAASGSLGNLSHGVLEQYCEATRARCTGASYNIAAFKGLIVGAALDWTQATGYVTYDRFLLRQADAVLAHAASDGVSAAHCGTPTDCQLSLYWARREPVAAAPIPATAGTQTAALSALTAGLLVAGRRA